MSAEYDSSSICSSTSSRSPSSTQDTNTENSFEIAEDSLKHDSGHIQPEQQAIIRYGLHGTGSNRHLLANKGRLWNEIHHTAQWGGIPGSPGMARLALSDEDRCARDYFVREATNIGCKVNIDQMGNIFAVLSGENNTIHPIGIGSHLDTQPAGK
jgi:hypothetical protein